MHTFSSHFCKHRGQDAGDAGDAGEAVCGLGGCRIRGFPGTQEFEDHCRSHWRCKGYGTVLLMYPIETTERPRKGKRLHNQTLRDQHLVVCEQRPFYTKAGDAFEPVLPPDTERGVCEVLDCHWKGGGTRQAQKRHMLSRTECVRKCAHLYPNKLSTTSAPWFVLGQLYNLKGAMLVLNHALDTCEKRHEESTAVTEALRQTRKLLSPYQETVIPVSKRRKVGTRSDRVKRKDMGPRRGTSMLTRLTR